MDLPSLIFRSPNPFSNSFLITNSDKSLNTNDVCNTLKHKKTYDSMLMGASDDLSDDASPNASELEGQEDTSNEADGVWSVEIEQYFQEALDLYPPCGRRKIILAEEGKMYGRNELIARYIHQRTGKIRTRKQVSSHIQVLARRKSKEVQSKIHDPDAKLEALNQLSRLSSAQIVSSGPITSTHLSTKPIMTHVTDKSINHAQYGFYSSPPMTDISKSALCGQIPGLNLQASQTRKTPNSSFNSIEHEDVIQRKIRRLSDPKKINVDIQLDNIDQNSQKSELLSQERSPFSFVPNQNSIQSSINSFSNAISTHLLSEPQYFKQLNFTKNMISSEQDDRHLQWPHCLDTCFSLNNYPDSSYRLEANQNQFIPNGFPSNEILDKNQQQFNFSDELGYQNDHKLKLDSYTSNQLLFPNHQLTSPPNLNQWINRSIASQKLRLVELCAFVEYPDLVTLPKIFSVDQKNTPLKQHYFARISACFPNSLTNLMLEEIDASQIWDKFPQDDLKQRLEEDSTNAFFLVKLWADINTEIPDGANYAVSTIFEGIEDVPLQVSTRLYSYSSTFVEKLEDECPVFENGRYVYKLLRSPMCSCMKRFITKLVNLSSMAEMNQVLENFTILQTIKNKNTDEVLLGIAYILEVSKPQRGSQHHIYRLAKPSMDTNRSNAFSHKTSTE